MDLQDPDSYRRAIRELSDRLVAAQTPIRILDAIKWDTGVQRAFFAAGCKEQPAVDADYYAGRPLPFDPEAKRLELESLERDISRTLGRLNPVGAIMRRICGEYLTVVEMLVARGRPEFSLLSQELYGGAGDVFHAGEPTLADFADMMAEALANIDASPALHEEERNIGGEQAVAMLQERLDAAFAGSEHRIRVLLDDGIIADASAGADYIKIRSDASFSESDVRMLEVHEGWVHLGTTLNGLSQPVCTFLSKGPPSSTITQEGLAILMEIIAFTSRPARVRRISNRVRAIKLAEAGATFLEVFAFFQEQGCTDTEAYANAARVYRGSTPTGGPFTKDIAYSKGFVLTYNYMQLAVRRGLLDRIPLLFCGKTNLEDLRVLAQLVEEKIVAPPRFLPRMVSDMHALTAWMCYSNFLNHLDLDRISADYANLL